MPTLRWGWFLTKIKMKKIKSCAGCRALLKRTNDGLSSVFCYLDKPMLISITSVLDKRLDFEVFREPIENCKITSNSA
jgi:hypothetical protein